MSDVGACEAGDRFALLDAAYVLGALDPDERAEYEAHLDRCMTCRMGMDELRPTIGLLAAARASGAFDAEPAGPVPDMLLPDLLRRAAGERRQRRWLLSGVAAVAAACLVALIVVAWPASRPSARPVARPVALQKLRATPVEATAALVSRRWGTEIDVHCRYEHYRGGAPAGFSYGLRVIDTSAGVHNAGSWALVAGGVTRFTGGTDVRRDRIARVQIVLPDGTAILQLVI